MKNIFNKKFSISSFLIISALIISIPVKAQNKNDTDDTAKLKAKIEMLQKKIQKQEEEISRLQSEVENLKKKNPLIEIPKPDGNKEFRKGKPFEFNGELYYMVPLNKDKLK